MIARRDPAEREGCIFTMILSGRMQALRMNRASSTALSMMPVRLTDEHDLIGQQKHYQYDA